MSEFSSTSTTDVTPLPSDPETVTGHVAPAAVVTEEEEGESFSDIFSAYQRTSDRRSGEEGRQIRGTVVAVNAESVFVDIGFKSEGILPLTAFPAANEPVKQGDTLMVSVKGRDPDGYYGLSLFRVAQPKDWSSLQAAFADGTNIVGTVTAVVKGGLHVDVGVRAFLPASRSGARDAAEMEKLVGQEILCRITKLDVVEEDVVIDRRVVTEEEALKGRDLRFAAMQEGAIVDGTVRSLADYGAFIDLGGIDGLLHVSDMAWSRIGNPSDVLEVGQTVQVKVLKIDPESRRISLGLKQLQPHPWDDVAEKFAVGDRVRGTVTRTAEFGAFVEIAPGIEGLVHLSEMSWSKRIHKATEVLNVGDTVDALILAIGVEDRRISLGLKQALGDPWVEAAERIKVGSVVEGPVVTIMKFGAFVQIAEGVQGLVHISEITAERRLNHPSDVLRVGEVVKAQVLEIDKEKRQLRLSIKQLVPTSLDEFLEEHKTGDPVTGRVVSIENGVARVELGEGIIAQCVLPTLASDTPETPAAQPTVPVDLSAFSSMLKSKWKSGDSPAVLNPSTETKKSEAIKAGQVRSFVLGKIDPTEKSIELVLDK
ncbi:30S ribosomal protein S1 [Terriglobus saanensis]|uniref:RNA binding S1 domain protein n=1 Tax=Terriglobus saanensis (strain ATCC BAA-1853 / DSM 23119 / SP1PR4) TaxID=401053 RepID=E8V084_TERSS|nr:30S ribosomal protein S1 [Terriglobus saanensis]ADV83302.1 RNA binding S1 domain protein [Terriglobus saanensis SP1PR4]